MSSGAYKPNYSGNGRFPSTHIENDTGICIFDKSNQRSVYNIVPKSLQCGIERVNPAWFNYCEDTLEKKLKPRVRDSQLRLSFWNEYFAAQDQMRDIRIIRICDGVCSIEYFMKQIVCDPERFAWILCPVTDYFRSLDEMFYQTTRKMREVIKQPIHRVMVKYDTKGRKVGSERVLDYQLIKILSDLHTKLENRKIGAVVQNFRHDVNQKNLNLNVSASNPTSGDDPNRFKTLEEVEAEIARLESSIKSLGIGDYKNDSRVQNAVLLPPDSLDRDVDIDCVEGVVDDSVLTSKFEE